MAKKPNLDSTNDHKLENSSDPKGVTLDNNTKDVLASEKKEEVVPGNDAPEAPASNSVETVSENETVTETVTETEKKEGEVKAETEVEAESNEKPVEETENKDVVATLENPPKWILEHRERMGKDTFEGLKTNHEIVAAAITKCISDRSKTVMPPLTEAEILAFVGKQAKLLDIKFVYTDEINKTKGYIEIKEFKNVIRVPKEGEFTFGIDYSRGV